MEAGILFAIIDFAWIGIMARALYRRQLAGLLRERTLRAPAISGVVNALVVIGMDGHA